MIKKQKILNLIKKEKGLYYSDIAKILNLDLEETVKLCTELERENKIENF